MRLFIGIELNKEIKSEIMRNRENLKMLSRDLKFIQEENLHMTIEFLGEVDATEIEKIKMGIDSASGEKKFCFKTTKAGAFPNTTKPRVLFIDVSEEEKFLSLHERIKSELKDVSYKREDRKFTPHLTLAYVRKDISMNTLLEIGKAVQQLKIEERDGEVKSIILFESILTNKGPTYKKIYEKELSE